MSVDSKTLERIKAQLREAQATGGNVQQDLYGHLTEVTIQRCSTVSS